MNDRFNRLRPLLPHSVLEQTGVLTWVIAVLVIGLRMGLIVPDQPVLLSVLQYSATVLAWAALLIWSAVAVIGGVQWMRSRQAMARDSSVRNRGRITPDMGQLLALGVDCLLAAAMIWTAIGWAAQSSLSLWHVVRLIGLGALHIVLITMHDRIGLGKR